MSEFILGFAILGISLTVGLMITVPLTGSLVRLRANYNPKGLQLDEEGVVHPYTGPQVTSFFGMLARVKRIEGWSGLYKGLMPALIAQLVILAFALLFFDIPTGQPRTGGMNVPDAGPIGILFYSTFWMIVSLPAMIISYRAITTPYKLPYFNLMHSLRILLTPTEMRRPWVLYLTPGLMASQMLAAAYGVLVLRSLRNLILPQYVLGEPFPSEKYTPFRMGMYFIVVVVSTAILCPLEVMSTKLAIQRNHAMAEYNSVSQEVEGDAEGVDYAGTDEDVIGLRNEKDPYMGLVDCAKSIVNEEGVSALYRAWWITLLVCMLTSL